MTPEAIARAATRTTGRRRAARPGSALLLALAFTSCSYKFDYPAPPRREWPNPVLPSSSETRCTDVVALPIADTILGGSFATLSYVERHAGSPWSSTTTPPPGTTAPTPPAQSNWPSATAIVLGAAALPFLVSAVYGYIETDRCHRYRALFDQQGRQ